MATDQDKTGVQGAGKLNDHPPDEPEEIRLWSNSVIYPRNVVNDHHVFDHIMEQFEETTFQAIREAGYEPCTHLEALSRALPMYSWAEVGEDGETQTFLGSPEEYKMAKGESPDPDSAVMIWHQFSFPVQRRREEPAQPRVVDVVKESQS